MPAKSDAYATLRGNVGNLGRLLGETIAEAEGPDFLTLIERIRLLSKSAREGNQGDQEVLLAVLKGLNDDQLVPVARAFSQFLNLANIADQYHSVSRRMAAVFSPVQELSRSLAQAREAGHDQSKIADIVKSLRIELVLTAHPTEITRRTLIHKHREISRCLEQLELTGLSKREIDRIQSRLRDLLAQIWYGYDFRTERPTPVEEARWGFAVIEDSLWQAVPEFLRILDEALENHCGTRLPVDSSPVSFASWIGSDRDGNPNVTAAVTAEVLLLSRWQATQLYLRDTSALIEELSMTVCNESLRQRTNGAHEPYRFMLRALRDRLRRTLHSIEAELVGKELGHGELLYAVSQLWEPLHACYQSMIECGMDTIANGALLDLLRRVRCFGVHLVRHDVRQESSRHTQAIAELTRWLGLGDYEQWDEAQRCRFIRDELSSRRPLIPTDWLPSEDTKEVFDTFRMIACQHPDTFGAYIVSDAANTPASLAESE